MARLTVRVLNEMLEGTPLYLVNHGREYGLYNRYAGINPCVYRGKNLAEIRYRIQVILGI